MYFFTHNRIELTRINSIVLQMNRISLIFSIRAILLAKKMRIRVTEIIWINPDQSENMCKNTTIEKKNIKFYQFKVFISDL